MTLLLLLRPSKSSDGGPIPPTVTTGGHFIPQYEGKRPWEKEKVTKRKSRENIEVPTVEEETIPTPSYPALIAPPENTELNSQLLMLNNLIDELKARIQQEGEMEVLKAELAQAEIRKQRVKILLDEEDFITLLLN